MTFHFITKVRFKRSSLYGFMCLIMNKRAIVLGTSMSNATHTPTSSYRSLKAQDPTYPSGHDVTIERTTRIIAAIDDLDPMVSSFWTPKDT